MITKIAKANIVYLIIFNKIVAEEKLFQLYNYLASNYSQAKYTYFYTVRK